MKNADDDNSTSAVYFQEKWEPGGYVREEMNVINGEKRKRTAEETASICFGYINIVLAISFIVLCVVAFFSFEESLDYMIPWNRPSNDEVLAICFIVLCVVAFFSFEESKDYMIPWNRPSNDEVLMHVIWMCLGFIVLVIMTLIFFGMSIALIVGVHRKRPGALHGFIVYTSIMLAVYVIINVFYFVMIGLRNEYGIYVIYPQIGLLLFNVLFTIEVLTVYKAYKNMKAIASYTPTRLQDFETL